MKRRKTAVERKTISSANVPTTSTDIEQPEYSTITTSPAEVEASQITSTTRNERTASTQSSSMTRLEAMLEKDELEEDVPAVIKPKETYYNFTPKVKVSRLYDYVMQRSADEYKQEFQLLPKGSAKSCSIARKSENIVKNRYTGMYPYDHSRVMIKEDPLFFINASYIDGYKREKAYIASLGPTEKATEKFATFWKMVWHENSDTIVMLTNLQEASGMKCEMYWPKEGRTEVFGDVIVACRNEDVYSLYTVRTFLLKKNKDQRKLTQLHFTAWPDKSVPDYIFSLVEFWQRVKLHTAVTSAPVIVHCSAGVGRTGTFIALDRLTDEGRAEGSVNVYGCILDMREKRVNMVQTVEQYIYLHKCVAYTLTFGSEPVQADLFRQHVGSKDKAWFGKQFKQLQKAIEAEEENEDKARDVNKSHLEKNRRGADIPGNRKRPRLHLNRNFNDLDYINAVYVDSFKKTDSYIAAQTPLPATIEDFICLLFQENVVCVVSLDNMNTTKEVGVYLPADNQTLTCGPFTVSSSRCERKADHMTRTLTIQYSGQTTVVNRTLDYFHYTQWNDVKHIPEDAEKFVQFVKDVGMKARSTDAERPVLVHCLDGAERSGLFCAVSLLIDKMQAEQQVSVDNTLRHIKASRKSSILNKDQLEFCYRCVLACLDLFFTYSNFAT